MRGGLSVFDGIVAGLERQRQGKIAKKKRTLKSASQMAEFVEKSASDKILASEALRRC
jgi:hypothetical protein